MQRDHIAWLIVTRWGQCQDVDVLENVHVESCMRATRHAFILFCSMHPDISTIRAPLNGNQFGGHVYAHLA